MDTNTKQNAHTGNRWKWENDCTLLHPTTGKPITGRRIFSDNGFQVAEIYFAEPQDAALMEAAPAMYEALRELLKETDQHATGECEGLLSACKNARAALAAAERRK